MKVKKTPTRDFKKKTFYLKRNTEDAFMNHSGVKLTSTMKVFWGNSKTTRLHHISKLYFPCSKFILFTKPKITDMQPVIIIEQNLRILSTMQTFSSFSRCFKQQKLFLSKSVCLPCCCGVVDVQISSFFWVFFIHVDLKFEDYHSSLCLHQHW